MEFKKFIKQIFQAENGNYSSKRFIGILGGVSLCGAMLINTFTEINIQPSDSLVNAVALLSFGCLGLTSGEKMYKTKIIGQIKSEKEKENDLLSEQELLKGSEEEDK